LNCGRVYAQEKHEQYPLYDKMYHRCGMCNHFVTKCKGTTTAPNSAKTITKIEEIFIIHWMATRNLDVSLIKILKLDSDNYIRDSE